MPTGYTHAVQEGEVTELRQFAMRCARAFGALITMRDDPSDAPIPNRLEPSTDYHDEHIRDAAAQLSALQAMTEVECESAARSAYEAEMAAWQERADTRSLHRRRYNDMLDKVRAWQPPEAVAGLKRC